MNNILKNIVLVVLIAFAYSPLVDCQDDLSYNFTYEVNCITPPLSISKKVLNRANTISDLNRHFKASWVKEYKSVEITAFNNGKQIKATGKTESLTQEQINIMKMADVESDISVNIQYMPQNTLPRNEMKEIIFDFTIIPENEAKFIGGKIELQKYLKEKAIDKIQLEKIKQFNVLAVKFTISEEGQIMDVHMFESSKDEQVDSILLEAICNMPNWKPAEYPNGKKTKQEFVFTVGDHTSCTMNLLNIEGRL